MNGQNLTLLAMSLSNAKAVVTPSILEEVLEALYLNPAAIGAQNQLAENFVLLVKKLAEQGLIQHVPSGVAVEEKKEEKKEEKEEEEEDLFGDDDDEDDDAAEAMEAKIRAEAEKKKAEKEANKKVEKSLMVIHIKPYDEETDLKALFKEIQATPVKGCKWSETCNICPLAYGICYLQISCVIEDEVCSEDDVIDAITQFEDEVQSTEVASFNKFS